MSFLKEYFQRNWELKFWWKFKPFLNNLKRELMFYFTNSSFIIFAK